MSWLSSGLKKLGHIAAPIVHLGAEAAGGVGGFLTGGPAGAYAGYKLGDKLGNIGQDALSGANVRKHLGDNLLGAGEAAAGGYLASGMPGLGGGGGIGGTGLGMGAAGTGAGGVADAAAGGGGGGIVSSIEGVLRGGAGKQLLGNGGLNLLGVAQGVNAAHLGQQSNQYAKDALNSAQNAYNEKAGIRQQALNGLQNPQAPDLSHLSQIASAIPQLPQNYAGSVATADPSTLQPLAFAGAHASSGPVPTIKPGPAAPSMSIEQLQQLLHAGNRFA